MKTYRKAEDEEDMLNRFANSGKPFKLLADGDIPYTDKDIRIFRVGDVIPKDYSSYGIGGKISRIDFECNDDRFLYVVYLVQGCVVDTTIMGKMKKVVHPDYWARCVKEMAEIDRWTRYQRERDKIRGKMAPWSSRLMELENEWRSGRFE